jgi:CheY-like chemotaxis protein
MTSTLGRVLVVDDDDVIRQLITVNLELEGFEVTTAVDGQDCLDKVKDVDPVVITLDVMMPRMDGWEAASRLRADPETAGVGRPASRSCCCPPARRRPTCSAAGASASTPT